MKLNGLELSEYGPDEIIVARSKREKIAASKTIGRFFRSAVVDVPSKLKIDEVLGITDELLHKIADEADVEVIGHDWGVYKRPAVQKSLQFIDDMNQCPLLPDGYSLVASVQTVLPSKIPYTETPEALIFDDFCKTRTTSHSSGLVLSDMSASQCVNGIETATFKYGTHIVDIEPRLRYS